MIILDCQLDWIKRCLRWRAFWVCQWGFSRNNWHVGQKTEAETYSKCGQHSLIGWRPGQDKSRRNKKAAADTGSIPFEQILDCCCNCWGYQTSAPSLFQSRLCPVTLQGVSRPSVVPDWNGTIDPSCSEALAFWTEKLLVLPFLQSAYDHFGTIQFVVV